MRIILTILIIAFVFSCRTASRTVEKQRESIEEFYSEKKELELKNDSAYFTFSEKNKTNSLISLLSALKVNYNGSNEDELTISLHQAENGTELKIKGKGRANFKSESESKTETENSINHTSGEIHQNKTENLDKSVKTEYSSEKIQKNQSSKITGFQFSFWIWLIILSIAIVCLYWFFGRPKK